MAVNEVAIEFSETRAPEESKPDTSWRSDSVCRTHPTRWWFAGDYRESTRAKEICAECLVRSPCLEYALSRPDLLGIWAATTPNERAALRRDRRTGRAPVVSPSAVAAASEPETVETIALASPDGPDAAVEVGLDLVFEAAFEAEVAPQLAPQLASVLDRGPGRAAALDRRPDRDAVRAWPTPATAHLAPGARNGDDLLTPAEAGARLGVTPNTVTRWSRAGKLSAIHTMGGHRRFRRSEIERVLREANCSPTDPVPPAPPSDRTTNV